MSFSQYRRYFPITKSDIYLNHAAVSPFSTLIKDAIVKVVEFLRPKHFYKDSHNILAGTRL